MILSPASPHFRWEPVLERLRGGGVVAFPTETVYGLGADAAQAKSVRRVFELKKRPSEHPLIVHLAHRSDIHRWAVQIPKSAYALMEAFWPGPLTLVLPKHPRVSRLVTGNQSTIAIRVPQHPIALELLKQWGGGLVGPSANLFSQLSPTTAAAVLAGLGPDTWVLEGGSCTVGIESTIVWPQEKTCWILRPGLLSPQTIGQATGLPTYFVSQHKAAATLPIVPGARKIHYAPKKPLILCHSIAALESLAKESALISHLPLTVPHTRLPDTPTGYAARLYATLHALDETDKPQLAILCPPNEDDWAGIRNRLERAALPSSTDTP